ncbi:glutathione S-transferase 1-1-like [Bacillus rossius redtenbacheri]|uniref:glutathione S-transferase 1-1-like n=1 Tax=Bacillus rossius redtenbacheri TaxID=93214 RepID=UPI002FDC9CCA
MAVTLYSMSWSPPCRAVLLLAEELGIKVNIKPIETTKKDHLKPEFIKINPQHCVPTLDDDGFILWESRAIMAYLVEQYAKEDSLYPKDPKKRAIVNQRLYFDMNPLFSSFKNYFVPVALHKEDPHEPFFTKMQEAVGFFEKFLEGKEWAAGDNITIADYTLAVTISDMQAVGLVLSHDYPNVTKWLDKVKASVKGSEEQLVKQSKVMGHMFMKNLKTF